MAEPIADEERIAWLRLARSGGVGPRTFRQLLQRFGTAERALGQLPRLAREIGSAPDRFRLCPPEAAESELERLGALGGRLLVLREPAYPERLRAIEDAPPVISVFGDAALLAEPAVAIVGARNASGNGRLFARHMAKEVAAAGVVVVSGLARGIDTAAHEGALEHGTTVAVVASGIDVPYPRENAALMARIATQGVVLSERPLGREPEARHFPRRNRLIAGLALGVVVVEAAPKSGSLITARLAGEQGREVMAVPGTPLDPRHRGTNQLLREGAMLVESAADVLAALGVARRQVPRRAAPAAPPVKDPPAPPSRPVSGTGSDRDPVAARVRATLGPEPLLVDELIRQCHASSAEVQHALMELELDGRIERHPGGRVSLASA